MANKEKSSLKDFISKNINNNRIVWGVVLNQLFNEFVDTFQFQFIVASTGERNALKDKFEGMFVYVKGDTLYVLESDLTTWSPFIKSNYTKSQIDSLLDLKVSTES